MSSDIKLDGDWVVIEGTWIKGQVCDLILDKPDRRIDNNGVRRALVHDFNDGLTINYDGDYPGGVKIQGNVVLPDELNVEDIRVAGKNFARRVDQGTERERLALGDETDPVAELRGAGLQVNGKFGVTEEAYFTKEAHFTKAPQVPDITISPPPFNVPVPPVHLPGEVQLPDGWLQPDGIPVQLPAYSLLEKITQLEAEIRTLKDKVAALENNPG